MKEEELVKKTISLFQQHKYKEVIDLLFAHTRGLQPLLELEKKEGKRTARENKQLNDLATLRLQITKRLQALGILVISDPENIRRIVQGMIFYLSTITPEDIFKKQIIYASTPV